MNPRCRGDANPDGVILAHPSGNEFFRHLALALDAAGCLEEVCTCLDWRTGSTLDRLLPRRLSAELRRRDYTRGLVSPIASHPWREAARLAAGRLGWRWISRHEAGPFSVDAVYRDFDAWVSRRLRRHTAPGIAYAYEDAAEATFREACRLGWRRVYDLPIAYWETSRRMLDEEAARWPKWEPTLGGTRDSARKHERKTRELQLAEVIVCPSRFVADSLPDWARASKRIVMAPFGSPDPSSERSSPSAKSSPPGRPKLRILFAGGLTQRKGLADLFAAVRLLARSDVELVVFGAAPIPIEFYLRELPSIIYEPPRSHSEVLSLMRSCDVLCLPSIVEGRALVVQEAMSQGLPVIITPNTGADDVVDEGRSGFVVPIRSPEAIAEKLAWFADHRELLPDVGRLAREGAARLSWKGYGSKIVSEITLLNMPNALASH